MGFHAFTHTTANRAALHGRRCGFRTRRRSHERLGAGSGTAGESDQSSVRQSEGLSLPAREAKLLDLAKKEGGTLELYTSLSSLITRNLLPAFEKAYPGIKVNLYRASSETLTQRILSEVSAGVAGPDVIETNGTEMSFFQNKTCRTGIRALAAGGPQTWSSDEEALAKRDHGYPPQLLRQAWDSVARRLAPG